MVYFINAIYNWFVFGIAKLRAAFWGMFLKKSGRSVYIFSKCMFMSPHGIEIGDYVLIGNNVNLLSSQHRFDILNVPIHSSGIVSASISIENDGAMLL